MRFSMKDFRASEAVFICDECGEELKILDAEWKEDVSQWEVDLECRECGPQGKDFTDYHSDSELL